MLEEAREFLGVVDRPAVPWQIARVLLLVLHGMAADNAALLKDLLKVGEDVGHWARAVLEAGQLLLRTSMYYC